MGLDGAAVHLDQSLHQRQADAESALGALQGTVHLREHVEDAGQHLCRNADAGVLDPDQHMVALPLGGHPNATALVHVLGSVVQQVRQHLRQPGRVRFELDRLWWDRDREFVAPFLDERAAGFDGAIHHRRQLDPLLAEFDLASGDAGHVQQVIDQPGHLVYLPVDHLRGPLQFRYRRTLGTKDLHRIADRGQRVAELVGQHRQELVLAAVGLLERRQEPRILDGDDGTVGEVFCSGQIGGVVYPT